MKIEIVIETGGPLEVGGTKDIILSLADARELWNQLNDLFGAQSDYSTDLRGKPEKWAIPPITCGSEDVLEPTPAMLKKQGFNPTPMVDANYSTAHKIAQANAKAMQGYTTIEPAGGKQ